MAFHPDQDFRAAIDKELVAYVHHYHLPGWLLHLPIITRIQICGEGGWGDILACMTFLQRSFRCISESSRRTLVMDNPMASDDRVLYDPSLLIVPVMCA